MTVSLKKKPVDLKNKHPADSRIGFFKYIYTLISKQLCIH